MINEYNVKKITVKASGEYDVIVGEGIITKVGEFVKEVINPCKVALITDDIVDKLYSSPVLRSLERAGFTVVKYAFKHGEQSKNLCTYGEILSFLADNQLTRTDAIVALGGGVVGDMAGFAAATYLRGIKYVQVPTTLLAQIDSSVGGKTAIDLDQGKNLVGAFCQPKLVVCDIMTLYTLPERIFTDGMGEAAKYAILDKEVYQLLSGEERHLLKLICLCIDYKRKIVEKDEFEGGERRLLNLGHTLAHGIERLSSYSITHGSAVAMGLKIVLDNALRHQLIDQTTYDGMISAVNNCAGESKCPYQIKDICEAALTDKKRSGNQITLIMPFGVGDCRPVSVNVDELWGYLQ